jgi:hypothetical protein
MLIRAPALYKRIGENSFCVLPENGELGGFVCPLSTAKAPSGPPL